MSNEKYYANWTVNVKKNLQREKDGIRKRFAEGPGILNYCLKDANRAIS